MSGFYSFVVQAPGEVEFPAKRVFLDRGMNAFNVLIDDLDGFLATLKAEGVTVTKMIRLDEHEPVPAEPEQCLPYAEQALLPSGDQRREG